MIIAAFRVASILAAACAWGSLPHGQAGHVQKPKPDRAVVQRYDWVPDAKTACDVAKAVIRQFVGAYGPELMGYRVALKGGKWIVFGTVPRQGRNLRGGQVEVHISKHTCQVTYVHLWK